MLLALGLVAIHAHLHLGFWLFFLIAGGLLLQQARTLNPYDAPNCLRQFKQNVPIGFLLALAFICGRL